eukprot:1041309-Pyramimonas_sp.AAC.1
MVAVPCCAALCQGLCQGLCCAVLRRAMLSRAALCCAELCCSVLCRTLLQCGSCRHWRPYLDRTDLARAA